MGAAGSMSNSSPNCTGSSPSTPEPSTLEPIFPDPIAFLSPFVSNIRLAQPFSASSSTVLSRIPTPQELQEELQGQARMAAKVQEAENKKASKARIHEGVRGQWWPCKTTDAELRELQNEGMISEHWSFMRDSDVPKPDADERVMTKAWVERGLSLPCSEFFLSIIDTYGLQPHNIFPNSYLLLSNFATLCEGHLGIRPDVKLWQFFFRVRKETKDKAMLNCGSMTFMLRLGRMYPPHDSHESVRYWNAGWFYEKNISVSNVHDGLPTFSNKPPEELASWSFIPTLAQTPILEKAARRISCGDAAEEDPEDPDDEEERAPRKAAPRPSKRPRAKASGSEAGASGEASAKKPKVTKPPPLDSKKAERERLQLLATVGKRSRPNILGATNPSTTTTRTNVQEPITKYMKKPPAVGPATPAPPSAPKLPHIHLLLPQINLPLLLQPLHRKLFRLAARKWVEKTPEARSLPLKKLKYKAERKQKSTPPAKLKLRRTEKWELEQDLLNSMLRNAWDKPDAESSKIQDFKKEVGQFFDKLICKRKEQQTLHYELHKNIALQRRVTLSQAEKIHLFKQENTDLKKQLSEAQGASSSLAAASSELETLRASQKDLESKLVEAEKKLAEKSLELIRKEGEFQLKRKTDSETIKEQQKELGGFRKYMETAEQCWDLMNSDFMDPLGYNEERWSQFPRDDLLQLAGEDCKDLIAACRKICHNLSIKKSRTCDVRKLIQRMDVLPELVVDLQASSARGAAAMSLAMCLAHNPDLDIDRVTAGVPPDADVNALLDAVSGYDTRIARRIRHDEFHDKVVLPADELMRTSLPHYHLRHCQMKMNLYQEETSIARGVEEQLDVKTDVKMDVKLDMELDMKISHGRAREREACARGEEVVQPPHGRGRQTRTGTGPVQPGTPDPPGANRESYGANRKGICDTSGCLPVPGPV
ncbi:hypothetical protein QYE76_032576 [Lolium multiflorum]|uniref:Transposase (putative) gypsy type domain-containing protein n=1 Tax=Lolium multiflorum TaxID=4521 RepID=A0AAD8QTW4_LOLMU|nr:hypothetical protein QYE76_032576 [Lolium multiflorum]